MEQDQSMEIIIHRLAREALQKQRTEAFDEPEEALPTPGGGLGHNPMFKRQTEPKEQKLPLRTD